MVANTHLSLTQGRDRDADIPFDVWKRCWDEFEACLSAAAATGFAASNQCIKAYPWNNPIPAQRCIEAAYVRESADYARCRAVFAACKDAGLLGDKLLDRRLGELLRRELERIKQQRDAAKKAAAIGSVGMNDAAAILAGAAALVGFGSAAGAAAAGATTVAAIVFAPAVGVALILGVLSATAWYLGNRYTALTIDPPRRDFRKVSTYISTITPPPNPSQTIPEALTAVARQIAQLSVSIGNVVQTMERIDGLAATRALPADERIRLLYAQVGSLGNNSSAARYLLKDIATGWVALQPSWNLIRNAIADANHLIGNVSDARRTDELRRLWQEGSTTWPDLLQLPPTEVEAFKRVVSSSFQQSPGIALSDDPFGQSRAAGNIVSGELERLERDYLGIDLTLRD